MKRGFFLGALIVLQWVAVADRAPAAPDVRETLTRIATALKEGNAGTAEKLARTTLRTGILTSREGAQLLLDLGVALRLQRKRSAAVTEFTKAINLKSLTPAGQAEALFDRGATLHEMGQVTDAIRDYSAAIALVPTFASALNNRANIYRLQGHYSEAMRDYHAALAASAAEGNTHPEYAYYGLGQIAEAKNDKPLARKEYAKAVAANPQYDLAKKRLAALGKALANGSPRSQPVILQPPRSANQHIAITREPMHGPQVQLGAWRNAARAEAGWKHITQKAAELVKGLTPRIVETKLAGKGRYYRLRLGPVSQGRAKRLCTSLIARDINCFFVFE